MILRTVRRGSLVSAVAVALLVFVAAAPAQAADNGRWWYTRLDVAAANKISTGAGVTIAVIDSGVQADLDAFGGRVLPGGNVASSRSPHQDVPESPSNKLFGHGTAVAAYAAGGGRYPGVAPQAKILPVVTGLGSESSTLVQAIAYATSHGADIINMSVNGASDCTPQLQNVVDAALRKGIILVAGTGNTAGVPIGDPANCVGVLGVGGLDDQSGFVSWPQTTTGTDVDFVAPAGHLAATLLDGTLSRPGADGTSLSAALVSGTFALLRAKFPTENARQLVTRALWNVKNNLGGKIFAKRIDDKFGYGEILPRFALTEAPPAGAANPIYDEIDKHLAATSSGSASSRPTTGTTSPAQATENDSGGTSTGLVVGIVVAVVVVLAVILLLVARGRRRTPPGTPPGATPPGMPPQR